MKCSLGGDVTGGVELAERRELVLGQAQLLLQAALPAVGLARRGGRIGGVRPPTTVNRAATSVKVAARNIFVALIGAYLL